MLAKRITAIFCLLLLCSCAQLIRKDLTPLQQSKLDIKFYTDEVQVFTSELAGINTLSLNDTQHAIYVKMNEDLLTFTKNLEEYTVFVQTCEKLNDTSNPLLLAKDNELRLQFATLNLEYKQLVIDPTVNQLKEMKK